MSEKDRRPESGRQRDRPPESGRQRDRPPESGGQRDPLPALRRAIDWGELAPLRIRAREVAEGLYSGMHRSILRGAGVEFGGFREYVVGDDLRWLDQRALLRHDRLVVRQFETETVRSLRLLVDASASMGYRGKDAPGAKFAFAGLVAAALARIALASGDPVGVAFAGGDAPPIGPSAGRDQFDRIVTALESARTGGDVYADPAHLGDAAQAFARGAPRGTVFVVLSDLFDWPESAAQRFAALATGGRVLVVVQTLDPSETRFSFAGNVRLRALEGGAVVETDADATRARYLDALARVTAHWRDEVIRRGGRFLSATTSDAPVDLVREVAKAVRRQG
jgi:uncharacterized protein (DUF58 family)